MQQIIIRTSLHPDWLKMDGELFFMEQIRAAICPLASVGNSLEVWMSYIVYADMICLRVGDCNPMTISDIDDLAKFPIHNGI